MKVKSFFQLSIFMILSGISFSATNAQNARIEALGQNFVIDDLSAVSGNPASCINFPDQVQATAYQDGSFGPVVGLKSLGKHFVIGITANTLDYYENYFFDDANAYFDSTIDTTNKLGSDFPPYPHLIFGINLSNVTLGCDLFYKRAKLESTYNSSDGYEELIKKEISITGFRISSSFKLFSLGLYPYFYYCLPKAQGTTQYNGIYSDTISINTTNNATTEAGIELDLNINSVDFRIGGCYALCKYSFNAWPDSIYGNPQKNLTTLICYSGLSSRPRKDLLLSIAYSFSYDKFDHFLYANEHVLNSLQTYTSHYFVGSCEYIIPLKHLFDNIIIRSGINWYISNSTYSSHSDSSSFTSDDKSTFPTEGNKFTPAIGIGLKKGIMSFDISSKLAGWSGIIAGMPVVTGTLTFDFARFNKEE